VTAGSLLLRNALLLDPAEGSYVEGDIRCADGRIIEVGNGLTAPDARTEDVRGAVVMPGLIDAHVHVTALTADLGSIPALSPSYVAAHGARIMAQMLDRGFTTVRDVAGADYGLADAQAEGLIRGPRLLFCGRALSQTGGHGDGRNRGTHRYDDHPCCAGLSRIADGVDAVRAGARDELRVTPTATELGAVAPRRKLRAKGRPDAHQLEPLTQPRQADVVGGGAQSRPAIETLALVDRLPALLERREIPSPATRTDDPQSALRRVEGEPAADREPLDGLVDAEIGLAEEAVVVHRRLSAVSYPLSELGWQAWGPLM
jgi:hypothetical protein